MIKERHLLEHVRLAVKAAGGQAKLAKEAGISQTSVSYTLNGTIEAPEKLLEHIGYRKVITYQHPFKLAELELADVQIEIKKRIQDIGITKYAKQCGVSRPCLYRALAGGSVNVMVLVNLGLKRVVMYEQL